MRTLKTALTALILASALVASGPASALTLYFDDLQGLDDGGACASTASSCAINENFDVGPGVGEFGRAAGTITWVSNLASINLSVASVRFVGSYDGVEEILFTNLTYTVSNWTAFDLGGTITGFGSPTGTVSGTYEQFDGSSVSVSGPTVFSKSVKFSNLLCTNSGASEVCGFSVGTLRDFKLDVGATTPASHDFTHTFNVAAPEPGTALLLGLGLIGLAAQRRRRA